MARVRWNVQVQIEWFFKKSSTDALGGDEKSEIEEINGLREGSKIPFKLAVQVHACLK